MMPTNTSIQLTLISPFAPVEEKKRASWHFAFSALPLLICALGWLWTGIAMANTLFLCNWFVLVTCSICNAFACSRKVKSQGDDTSKHWLYILFGVFEFLGSFLLGYVAVTLYTTYTVQDSLAVLTWKSYVFVCSLFQIAGTLSLSLSMAFAFGGGASFTILHAILLITLTVLVLLAVVWLCWGTVLPLYLSAILVICIVGATLCIKPFRNVLFSKVPLILLGILSFLSLIVICFFFLPFMEITPDCYYEESCSWQGAAAILMWSLFWWMSMTLGCEVCWFCTKVLRCSAEAIPSTMIPMPQIQPHTYAPLSPLTPLLARNHIAGYVPVYPV